MANLNGFSRRQWLRQAGYSSAAATLLSWLPSVGEASPLGRYRSRSNPSDLASARRVVWIFSPNGVVPSAFWPQTRGTEFEMTPILEPLAEFRSQMLVLQGIDNRVRGDGDDHMRGMSCLLTGIELFPGNIQGGGHTPAGWPKGHSIDQELKRFLQSQPETTTRLGSLEIGVLVPPRADVWTRWTYSGPNRPITPLGTPTQLYRRLYGDLQATQQQRAVLDVTVAELKRIQTHLSSTDRHLLDDHLQAIREVEQRLLSPSPLSAAQPISDFEVTIGDDQMPHISDLQQQLLVAALQADQARVATLQYDHSVGNVRMKFLGIEEGHHELSHDPDEKTESMEKLVKINRWYAEQVAKLARRLAQTPDPAGPGSLLDHTTLIWTNELGKGSSHTLNDIPFVLVGGGLGFQMGRSLQFKHIPHNRLWLSIAKGLGHPLASFGNPELCRGGVIKKLWS